MAANNISTTATSSPSNVTISNHTHTLSSENPTLGIHHHNTNEQALVTSIFTDQVSQTKLLASLILLVITLLCGYLPVKILLNQNYIQYAMFAGGGVLMATAFCHLIPEAHDNYKLSQTTTITITNHHHHHSHYEELSTSAMATLLSNQTTTALNLTGVANNGTLQPQLATSEGFTGLSSYVSTLNVPYLEVTLCCGFFFMYLVEQLMVRFINNHTHDHPCDTNTSTGQLVTVGDSSNHNGPPVSSGVSATSGQTSNLSVISGGGSGGISSATTSTELYKFIRGLLIVSAFGAHSIFDGVAIGSQETVEKVWTIFLAISCHKLIIAAVVGLELYAATLESHLWTLVHLTIFSIMSPIGIILVVVAQNSLHINSNHPVMILLQSFATGTLLYIVFVEILQPKENQAYDKNKFGKSLSLITGFALMLLVLTLIGE